MENIFSSIILKLVGLGFLDFLIFLLVLSIVYAFLKKTKMLGGSIVIDSIISFVIAFMVFVYPVITGISLAQPITTFFTQAFIFILIFVVAFLVASMFYPNLLEWLPKVFTSRNTLWGMVGLALAIFVTSGLVSVIYSASTQPSNVPTAPQDVSILAAGLIIFVVILALSSSIGK